MHAEVCRKSHSQHKHWDENFTYPDTANLNIEKSSFFCLNILISVIVKISFFKSNSIQQSRYVHIQQGRSNVLYPTIFWAITECRDRTLCCMEVNTIPNIPKATALQPRAQNKHPQAPQIEDPRVSWSRPEPWSVNTKNLSCNRNETQQCYSH